MLVCSHYRLPLMDYNYADITKHRVYAEDPTRNFLPSIGPLITYRQPQTRGQGSGDVMPFLLLDPNNKDATSLLESTTTVRVDTGVCEGATISMHYDPMISKLCSHAATR